MRTRDKQCIVRRFKCGANVDELAMYVARRHYQNAFYYRAAVREVQSIIRDAMNGKFKWKP